MNTNKENTMNTLSLQEVAEAKKDNKLAVVPKEYDGVLELQDVPQELFEQLKAQKPCFFANKLGLGSFELKPNCIKITSKAIMYVFDVEGKNFQVIHYQAHQKKEGGLFNFENYLFDLHQAISPDNNTFTDDIVYMSEHKDNMPVISVEVVVNDYYEDGKHLMFEFNQDEVKKLRKAKGGK